MGGDVSKNLSKLINNTLDDALVSGLERVCQSIENDAKRECPVDDGILRASITHYVSPLIMGGFIGTNIEYAPYVHEGTGIYAKGGNGRKEVPWHYQDLNGQWHSTKGQKPNDFLQRAVDKNRNNILNTLGEGASTQWKK